MEISDSEVAIEFKVPTRKDSTSTYKEKETEFVPDKLNVEDIISNVEKLDNGDILRISQSFSIVRLGGKNIAIDPAFHGRSFTKKEASKLIPPRHTDVLKSKKDIAEKYPYTMIISEPDSEDDKKKSNVQRVAEAMAKHIDIVTISHLDSDHYDFEFIRTMMEINKNMKVYGPLSWKSELAKLHSLEETGDKPTENYLTKDIAKRLYALSPKPSRSEKNKSLSYQKLKLDRADLVVTEKGLMFEKDKVPKSQVKERITIKSLDVPHTGSNIAEYNQGLVIEDNDNRIMVIPDAGLSPEIIEHIKNNFVDEKGKKLSGIITSVATLNPETFYGLPESWGDAIRDRIEESIAHSAYLPLIAAAVTKGEVPIYLTHGGFYFRSTSDPRYLRYRIPTYKKRVVPSSKEWLMQLENVVSKTNKNMEDEINKLGPLATSFGKRGRLTIKDFIKDFPIRRKFANNIIDWIKKDGVPWSVLKMMNMPQSNFIIPNPHN